MFYQLYHHEYLRVRSLLKPNEFDIYLYLLTKYPYSDSVLYIDTAEIAEDLGYHRRTVQLALQRLQSLRLIDIQIHHFGSRQGQHGYNSRVNTNGRFHAEDKSKSGTTTGDLQTHYCDLQTHCGNPQTHHTIYTDLDHTLSDPELRESTKVERFEGEIINPSTRLGDNTNELINQFSVQLEESPWDSESEECSAPVGQPANGLTAIGEITVQSFGLAQEPFTSLSSENSQEVTPPQGHGEESQESQTSVGTQSSTNRQKGGPRTGTIGMGNNPYNWLPEGPWRCQDGKLDPHFHDWLARDWVARYGGDLTKRRADVLLHFKKDPANLVIRWAQYQEDYVQRFQNTQTLINHGRPISPDYQEELTRNHRALTVPLPPEITVTRQSGPLLPGSSLRPGSGTTRPVNGPTPPPGADNVGAYRTWTPPAPPEDIASPEEIAAAFRRMRPAFEEQIRAAREKARGNV